MKGQTNNCVRCGKSAVFWAGHVLTKKDKNGRWKYKLAGWCCGRCYNNSKKGFFGHYQYWMDNENIIYYKRTKLDLFLSKLKNLLF